MAFSRARLEMFAAALNVDATSYPNDSKLEQAVLYAAKNLAASSSATTKAAPASAYQVSGAQNV